MTEHTPSWRTMGALVYEDENPQVTAKFIIDFGDGEFVEVPVGIGQPDFLTTASWDGNRKKAVKWITEIYTPDRPCRVVALRIDFIDYDDYALKAIHYGEGIALDWYETEEGKMEMRGISSSYDVSGNVDLERQLC